MTHFVKATGLDASCSSNEIAMQVQSGLIEYRSRYDNHFIENYLFVFLKTGAFDN